MIGPVHALVGYLIAYVSLKILKNKAPRDGVLAAIIGIIPDVDYFSPLPFGTLLGHHGIAHSPLILTLASMPALIKGRWRAFPYFLALMSHIATDFIDNTIPLLSPFSWDEFGLRLSLNPNTLLLAHLFQLSFTIASAHAIIRGWNDFPVSLPEKYDKLATPMLILLVLAAPFLIFLIPSHLQVFLNTSTLPCLMVSIILILSSSTLVLLIMVFNSKILKFFLHRS